MAWMQSKGWSMQIYESKAKFINGRWAQSGLAFGTSDAQGNTDLGHAAYVEFKAPGRLSSYNAEKNFRQRAYIEGKILTNAFAVVVDSAWRLSEIYEAWVEVRESGHELARSYLFAVLP